MIKPCHREAAKRLWRSQASNSCYSSYTPEIATPAGRLAMTQDFSCYKITGAMTASAPTTHRNDKAITWNLKRKGVSSHCALTLGNYRFCPSPPGNATNTNLSLRLPCRGGAPKGRRGLRRLRSANPSVASRQLPYEGSLKCDKLEFESLTNTLLYGIFLLLKALRKTWHFASCPERYRLVKRYCKPALCIPLLSHRSEMVDRVRPLKRQ